MSLKKTWFSYVLWFIFAVPSVFISYNVLTVVLRDFCAILVSYAPGYETHVELGANVLSVLAVVLMVILVRYLCSLVKPVSISKGLGIIGHIVLAAGIIAGFCMLRYSLFTYAYFLQTYSRAPSEQALCFFELSKIGAIAGNGIDVGTVSVLEQVYIHVLRTVFLFFGNKLEVVYFVQLFFQAATLILLMIIGRTLQRGIFVWIPALLYAVAPTFFYAASDAGITNFWIFVVVLGMFLICLFEKAWKRKNITYLVLVFAQFLFAGFVFFTKLDVLVYEKVPFVSGEATQGIIRVLDAEMLVLAILLIVYCVTFFMDKQDHRSLFIIPFATFGILFVWLSNYEYEASNCMMLLTMLNLFFMVSQSMRVIFRTKPDVMTGKTNVPDVDIVTDEQEQLEPARFEWAEMQEVMHNTEDVVRERTESVKVELPFTEVQEENGDVAPDAESIKVEVSLADITIDKKAPIENVLPMPKKHKPKILDYAFEPAEDMMHYDVEIENDEYDY